MFISFKKFVDITSGVGGAAAASRRDLGLRVFTTSDALAYDQALVCSSADDVMAIFGEGSAEYVIAANYFGYVSNSITKAKQISFVRWLKTAGIKMTSITGRKTPLAIGNFTESFGLMVRKGASTAVADNAFVSVSLGEGKTAEDYDEVAQLFTEALSVLSQQDVYGWLKGSVCEYAGGVFSLTFTDATAGATQGPDVSLVASDVEGVTDARRMMGLMAYNVWAPGKWTVADTTATATAWAPGTQYFVGASVTNESKTYYCKTAHTAGATFADDAANWVKIANWAASTSYSTNDYVVSGGKVWKCSTSHTSGTAFDESKFASCDWDDTAACSVGAFANFDGAVYFCIEAVAAPSGDTAPLVDRTLSVATETPKKAVSRVDGFNDDFGSFMFVEDLTAAEKKEVALWNKGKNYKYAFWTRALKSGTEAYATVAPQLNGYECCAVTYENRVSEFGEFMPAALFASTDYTRTNATKTFMYKQFAGVNPAVGLKTDAPSGNYATLWQDLDAKRINYYGQTMKSGRPLCFYQNGVCMDGTEISCACNEIWLKDAIETEVINLLLAMEKVPANTDGVEMINMVINGVIGEALANGAVIKEKTLTNTQKAYIDSVAGEKDAWQSVYSNGFWLNTALKQDNSSGSTVYKADYVLIYSMGSAIRKVTGSDIMI